MIILDTNVISALMDYARNSDIKSWFDNQEKSQFHTTVISLYELRFGIERVRDQARKQKLLGLLAMVIENDLQNRILIVDTFTVNQTAILAASRADRGRPQELQDTLIAGIARVHKAAIATRNTKHFQDAGVKLINPWEMA